MFTGEYHHNLDNKGRIAIPAQFRGNLRDGATLTRGLDKCLTIYPRRSWTLLVNKLANLSIVQANSRAFVRFMLSGAKNSSLDKQGRVIIPEYLRRYAGIKKKVVIIGLFDKIELWSEERWIKYRADTEKKSNQIAEKLGELGGI